MFSRSILQMKYPTPKKYSLKNWSKLTPKCNLIEKVTIFGSRHGSSASLDRLWLFYNVSTSRMFFPTNFALKNHLTHGHTLAQTKRRAASLRMHCNYCKESFNDADVSISFQTLLKRIGVNFTTLLQKIQMCKCIAFSLKVPFSFTNKTIPYSSRSQNKNLHPTYMPYALNHTSFVHPCRDSRSKLFRNGFLFLSLFAKWQRQSIWRHKCGRILFITNNYLP